jgi:hypothetical protein
MTTVTLNDMPSIPAGDNPFWHDSMSMGTNLVRGWMVMHEGFDRADEPLDLHWLVLVNTRTGERWRLTMENP